MIEWIILIIILATLPSYIAKKRGWAEVQFPLCLWRTKKGLKWLSKTADMHAKLLVYFADYAVIFCFGLLGVYYLYADSKKTKKNILSIAVGYVIFVLLFTLLILPFIMGGNSLPIDFIIVFLVGGISFFMLYILASKAGSIIIDYLVGATPTPGVSPVIPGLQVPGTTINVPISAWISIVVLLVVHELSHGLVARAQNIKVKSLGLLTAGVLPIGAFTEPDEAQLKKASQRKRMRVFAAGSMANFAAGFVFFLIFLGLFYGVQPNLNNEARDHIKYISIGGIEPGSPADLAGIKPGMLIYNYNELMDQPKVAGTEITLLTNSGNFTIKRAANGLIGLSSDYILVVDSSKLSTGYWVGFYSIEIIYWTYLLNFLVGMFNFMPLIMLDGGHLFTDLAEFITRKLGRKNPKQIAKKAFHTMIFIVLLLIIINVLPHFVK